MKSASDPGDHVRCSFCGKAQHEVRRLVAGPSVYICDECVELCRDIIVEELGEPGFAEPVPVSIQGVVLEGLRTLAETAERQGRDLRAMAEFLQKRADTAEPLDP